MITTEYKEMILDLNRVDENDSPYLLINEDLIIRKTEVINDDEFKMDETSIISKENNRFPEIYPVGVVHGTYIICQNEKGMYLIDQHAAKERINYEKYKQKLGNPSKESAVMLFPITIEYTNSEYIILKENFDVLKDMNFDIAEFGINSIIIKSHPVWLPNGYEEDAIKRIIEVILSEEKTFTIEKFNEKIAIMLSCKMAIKANENISHLEIETLINDLRKCDNPFNCPHGRPTTIFYSNYDLQKLFKRSGFEELK